MSKYDPLYEHLIELEKIGRVEWNATFAQVEKVLGFVLPNSARNYPEWWANENLSYTVKSQCKSWARANWKTAHVNIPSETVTFVSQVRAPKPVTYETSSMQNLKIKFYWKKLGELYLDHKGRLKFPDTTDIAAVYKLNIDTENGAHHYIGETDNLRRRFQGYRTPGPTQPTNKRLRAIMVSALSGGNNVSIEVLDISAKQVKANAEFTFGLGNKFVRRLYENAAILNCLQKQSILLNL